MFKESRDRKIFTEIVICLVSILICVLICQLRSTPDIMEKVLYTIGGLFTGILGGYGLGISKNRN